MDLYGNLPPSSKSSGEAVATRDRKDDLADKKNENAPIVKPVTKSKFTLTPTTRKREEHSSVAPVKKANNFVPTSIRHKSPVAKKTTVKTSGFSFTPMSISRKSSSSSTETKKSNDPPAPTSLSSQPTPKKQQQKFGFGFSTVTKVSTSICGKSSPIVAAVEQNSSGGSGFVAVVDEYVPLVPNDYMAYCTERKNQKKQEELARDLAKRQRKQEEANKKQREQLRQDVEEGNFSSISNISAGSGRGRGRNLPAWMTEKIVREKGSAINSSNTEKETIVENQFDNPDTDENMHIGLGFSNSSTGNDVDIADDKKNQKNNEYAYSYSDNDDNVRSSSDKINKISGSVVVASQKSTVTRVLLLLNMVGRGEVDGDLQKEVKEECQRKYGPVRECIIHEVPQENVVEDESVRIFIAFSEIKDAVKAYDGLNGRFFGGRKVKAFFYEEDKFNRYDYDQ